MSRIDLRPRTLFFVFQAGCGACEEAEPVFDEFVKEHPLTMALKISASGQHVQNLGVKVRATPTWIYRVGDQATLREGALSLDEVNAWVAQAEEALSRG